MSGQEGKRGSVTLETCVVLTIFFFLFLCIYGTFPVFSAQNQITHALVQASKSLSLDSYQNEHTNSIEKEDVSILGDVGLGDLISDAFRTGNDSFSSSNDWYKNTSEINDIARRRFLGFLAGSEDSADEKLKSLCIVGGADGVTVTAKVENEELTMTIKYDIQYWFNFFGIGKIPMEQTIHSHMWM